MPVTLEPPKTRVTPPRTIPGHPVGRPAIRIGLINNMPDSALQSTEAQFCGLLERAAGDEPLTVRLSSFPELPRGAEALARLKGGYWPIEELLAEGLDGLIITGTEPRAALLSDEPYWGRFAELLEWVQRQRVASIWSCLAAHAAVETLDGIQRQRLSEKRCGIYEHHTLTGHALLRGAAAPLHMPHSRWNELPLETLRGAGYTILSWSQVSGADAFVRHGASLQLFFQGHPEYESTTLLKEYRRDVGRYLTAAQSHYPTMPAGYLSAEASTSLEAFAREAQADRSAALLERFPFAAVAATLSNRWQSSAIAIYRNWLTTFSANATSGRTPEPVSFA